VILLLVYTFVFGIVFKSRWVENQHSNLEFAMILFAGLIVFNIFSDCISRAPSLITSNSNYVKKIIFPLEILPGVALGSALFHSSVNLIVWLLSYLVIFGLPPVTALFAPIVIMPIILLTLGLSWFLSALGVYLRDIGHLVGLFITVNLFISSIFYPLSALPHEYQNLVMLSPIAAVIEEFRRVMFFGVIPNWNTILSHLFICGCVAITGFAWFQKTRKGFADVI
jgi:lipopolysaccharide transport system permease protein